MSVQEPREAVPASRPAMKAMDTSVITAKTGEPVNKIFSVENVNFYYGEKLALKSINLEIGEKKATAFIGPSGCGKTTLLRCLNRMNDLVLNTRVTGTDQARRQKYLRPVDGRYQPAAPGRHDFSEMEPLSQEHLREYHLWACASSA